MTASIHEVLGELRATALDQRDKGDKFERLIQAYLKSDPEWATRFSDVWLWMEWPGREGRPDAGIDLVAANGDRDDFMAIQCKFYEPGHHVAKADIDSFIASSARSEFAQRIVFDTAAGWGGNAEETTRGVAQRIDIGYPNDAAIDWSQYRWETPEVVVTTVKKAPRPHQQKALDNVRTVSLRWTAANSSWPAAPGRRSPHSGSPRTWWGRAEPSCSWFPSLPPLDKMEGA